MTGSPADVNSHFTSSPTLYLRARAAATSVRRRGNAFFKCLSAAKEGDTSRIRFVEADIKRATILLKSQRDIPLTRGEANKQCSTAKNGRKPRQRIAHIHNEISNVTTAAIFKQLSPLSLRFFFLHFICAAAIRREILESHDWPAKVARACGNITARRAGKNVRSTGKDWNLSRFAGSCVQLHMLIRVRNVRIAF